MVQRFVKIGCKSTFLLLLVISLASTAMAQYGPGRARGRYGNGGPMAQGNQPPENLYKAMQAQGVASTITAGQLTADWRVITAGALGLLDSGSLGYYGYYNNTVSLYYTNGDLLSFGGQKYLVAYTLQESSDPDQRKAQQYYEDQLRSPLQQQQQRRTPMLLKDSVLALSLLSLSQTQGFHEIKKFDPVADIAPALSKAILDQSISQANLKQIALATFMYTQDYDEKFPPMVAARSADEFNDSMRMGSNFSARVNAKTPVQQLLMPYAHSSKFFLQPTTQRPYLPNYRLSRLWEGKIKNPSQIFLFYEDAPDADGTRNVVYADGHVVALPEAEFQKQRKAQGISESGYPSAAKPTHKAKATPKP